MNKKSYIDVNTNNIFFRIEKILNIFYELTLLNILRSMAKAFYIHQKT